jgi:hypothetical protein
MHLKHWVWVLMEEQTATAGKTCAPTSSSRTDIATAIRRSWHRSREPSYHDLSLTVPSDGG